MAIYRIVLADETEGFEIEAEDIAVKDGVYLFTKRGGPNPEIVASMPIQQIVAIVQPAVIQPPHSAER